MKQFYLAEIVTKDKLIHQGIYFEPVKKGRRAILYLNGLSSAFYREPVMAETFANACEREGWGYANFNNRGHDMLAGIRKLDPSKPYGYMYYPAGAGQEVFKESVYDIDAGIDFLVTHGFTEIILIGHSTGANKVCYWAATQKNPRVVGIILSGPMSDRADPKIDPKNIPVMKRLIKKGKGDTLMVGYDFFPITPKRYLSLYERGSTEDVFDYIDRKPKLTYFSKIKLPLLVFLAGNDEYGDRPQKEIKKTFDAHAKSPTYKSMIIQGALHRFNGHEKEAVEAIVEWVKTI